MMLNKIFQKTGYLLILIFALGLIVRIPYILDKNDNYFQRQGKPFSDARQNDTLAMNWLSGKGYGDYLYGFKYQAYRVPFYPFFLAFIYSYLGQNYLLIKIIQAILGAGTCIIIFSINHIVFNKWVGLISAFLWAFHFNFIIYTNVLLGETLFVFLFSSSILLIIKAVKEVSYSKAIASGILIAISALTRSAGIVLIPAALLWFCCGAKLRWKKAAQLALLILLSTLITIAPWFLRNYRLTGQPLLFSSIGALQLWNASNPDFYSINARKAWYEFHWSHPYDSEGERYKIANQDIKHFIKSNFTGYIASCYRRAYILYSLPKVYFSKARLHTLSRFTLPNFSVLFTLIFAAIGLILLLPQLRRISLLFIVVIGYSCFYFLAGDMLRYRMPVEIILVSFAAVFIYLMSKIHKIKSWNKIFDNESISPIISGEGKKYTTYLPKIFCFLLAALVIIFIGRMSLTYLNPQKSTNYPQISQRQIIKILKKKRLLAKWKSQGGKFINYNDLFQEQAENFGHFPKYRTQIVAWKGEVSHCLRNKNGNIINLTLRINPSPHHFGNNVINCFVHNKKIHMMLTQHIDDGDFVVVFGHLQEREIYSFSFPCIIFSHIEKLK